MQLKDFCMYSDSIISLWWVCRITHILLFVSFLCKPCQGSSTGEIFFKSQSSLQYFMCGFQCLFSALGCRVATFYAFMELTNPMVHAQCRHSCFLVAGPYHWCSQQLQPLCSEYGCALCYTYSCLPAFHSIWWGSKLLLFWSHLIP